MKYICLSNLHPDTNIPINPLFRVSGFVPVNIPIIIALGLIPPTVNIDFNSKFSKILSTFIK